MSKQPKKAPKADLIDAVVQDVELTAEQIAETAKGAAEAAGGVAAKVARLFRHDSASRKPAGSPKGQNCSGPLAQAPPLAASDKKRNST